jgi:tRNA pseudouridine38-40 synthase
MPRYFLEVAYTGSSYSGFQVQDNANSVQEEVEKAFEIFFRNRISMTGASRTDTGVHALQNFFHFDMEEEFPFRSVYNINAILPADIAINHLYTVGSEAHCRYDAESRAYHYFILQKKNPFLKDRAHFYPFRLNPDYLMEAASMVPEYEDFTSFSKRNTQAKTALCQVMESRWVERDGCLVYEVRANRFLRGMVRGLVGTMLLAGTGKLSLDMFRAIIEARDCTRADFSVPGHGLFLTGIRYPDGLLGSALY